MGIRHLIAFLLLLSAGGVAFADEAAIEVCGGVVRPMKAHPSIVMERMVVNIDLNEEQANVDCAFRFRNTGRATAVRMGFPEIGERHDRKTAPVGFRHFSTSVDGRAVRTRTEGYAINEHGDWSRWRAKTVVFSAGQTRRVRVRYQVPMGYSILDGRLLRYQLQTGASWKGPIGSALVRVHGRGDRNRAWLDLPAGFHRVGTWTFERRQRNIEPKDDLRISYRAGCVGISFAGGEVGGANAPGGEVQWIYEKPLPYTDDGVLWIQAQTLAQAIHAELQRILNGAVLVRGRRAVTFGQGSAWLEREGRRQRLAHAPRVEHNRLMVALRETAEALGAEVGFDPDLRITHVDFAFLRRMPVPKAQRPVILNALPPGWAPPEQSAYEDSTGVPWFCSGNLTGGGGEQYAFVLQRRDEQAVMGGSTKGYWYDSPDMSYSVVRFPDAAAPAPASAPPPAIRTRSAGVAQYWQDGDTDAPSGRLEMKRDGIEVSTPGHPTLLYYWQPTEEGKAAGRAKDGWADFSWAFRRVIVSR